MGPSFHFQCYRVQVFPYGLSDHEQACMMMSLKSNVGNGNGNVICSAEQLAIHSEDKQTGDMVARGTTHTVRLDELFKGEPQVDVVKIDVEGYEPYVMAGAGVLAAPLQG